MVAGLFRPLPQQIQFGHAHLHNAHPAIAWVGQRFLEELTSGVYRLQKLLRIHVRPKRMCTLEHAVSSKALHLVFLPSLFTVLTL